MSRARVTFSKAVTMTHKSNQVCVCVAHDAGGTCTSGSRLYQCIWLTHFVNALIQLIRMFIPRVSVCMLDYQNHKCICIVADFEWIDKMSRYAPSTDSGNSILYIASVCCNQCKLNDDLPRMCVCVQIRISPPIDATHEGSDSSLRFGILA